MEQAEVAATTTSGKREGPTLIIVSGIYRQDIGADIRADNHWSHYLRDYVPFCYGAFIKLAAR